MERFTVKKNDLYYEVYFKRDNWCYIEYVYGGRILGNHRISEREYNEAYNQRER